ncbi:hypothetical protein Bbelb_224320 [Branchiostoma belcheri]|nr:hypothetical protein Bbelb_224320 [Branchiostoma belcheri]
MAACTKPGKLENPNLCLESFSVAWILLVLLIVIDVREEVGVPRAADRNIFPSAGPGSGSRQRVQAAGPGSGSRQRVQAAGSGSGSRQRVQAAGSGSGSRQRVQAAGSGSGSRQRVQAAGPGSGSRQRVQAAETLSSVGSLTTELFKAARHMTTCARAHKESFLAGVLRIVAFLTFLCAGKVGEILSVRGRFMSPLAVLTARSVRWQLQPPERVMRTSSTQMAHVHRLPRPGRGYMFSSLQADPIKLARQYPLARVDATHRLFPVRRSEVIPRPAHVTPRELAEPPDQKSIKTSPTRARERLLRSESVIFRLLHSDTHIQQLYLSSQPRVHSVPASVMCASLGSRAIKLVEAKFKNRFTCVLFYTAKHHRCAVQKITCAVQNITYAVQEITCAVQKITCAVQKITCAVQKITCAVQKITCAVQKITCAVQNITCAVQKITCAVQNITCAVPNREIACKGSWSARDLVEATTFLAPWKLVIELSLLAAPRRPGNKIPGESLRRLARVEIAGQIVRDNMQRQFRGGRLVMSGRRGLVRGNDDSPGKKKGCPGISDGLSGN